MALGRQGERQVALMVGWGELPRSPGHAFHDRLQTVLVAAGFDGFAEQQCAPHYAGKRGRPSLPPGRYFRIHLVGYFEGIDSERGLEWRCADSLSLREFLRLGTTERVPGHSWLSRTRSRLPLEVHAAVFTWVLQRLAEHGLIRGDRIGVDEAKVAKMKDGRTRLGYKPEHAVDLDTGAIVAAEIHCADRGDTTTLPETLEAAEANLAAVDAAPTVSDPAELIADKGCHARDG
jgi:transposase